jgi:hypothetical protein
MSMKIPRVYAGEDGKSRLDSVEIGLFEDDAPAGDGRRFE